MSRAVADADAGAVAARASAAVARAIALRVWDAARAAGVTLDPVALGLDALLREEEAGEGAAAGANATFGLGLSEDVLTEGDGRVPRSAAAESSPHGASNVLCIAPLARCASPHSELHCVAYASGGALDKRVILSWLVVPQSDAPPPALASVQLPAPVLALALQPFCGGSGNADAVTPGDSQRCGLLAAACMDGSVHLIKWVMRGLEEAAAGLEERGEGTQIVSGELALIWSARDHSRYAHRLAWTTSGAVLATASVDGSSTLYCVGEGGGGAVRVAKLQQLRFAAGGVEAVAFACEQVPLHVNPPARPSRSAWRVDTLVLSVRGSPSLFYVRVLSWEGASRGEGAQQLTIATSLARATRGQVLPTLLPPDVGALLLHRAALSEDSPACDVSWGMLVAQHAAEDCDCSGAAVAANFSEVEASDVSIAPQGASATSAVRLLTACDAPAVHLPPPISPEGGRRVGFSISELACAQGSSPLIPGCPLSPPPLLAAGTDGGLVYVSRLGASGAASLRTRLLGAAVGATTAPLPTLRMAWQPRAANEGGDPHYLAVTTDGADGTSAQRCAALFSVTSGRRIALLGWEGEEGKGRTPPHSGTIKDLAFAAAAPPLLLTCGFDKRVVAWV